MDCASRSDGTRILTRRNQELRQIGGTKGRCVEATAHVTRRETEVGVAGGSVGI